MTNDDRNPEGPDADGPADGEGRAEGGGDLSHRLAAERNVWFVTVRPDGRPHLTPVWFVHVDDRFWVGTGARSVKVRNLTANPAVSVSLEDGDAPVVAEGRASLVERPFPAPVVEAFADRYGWDITQHDDPDIGEPALVRIDVDRWLLGGTGLPVTAPAEA